MIIVGSFIVFIYTLIMGLIFFGYRSIREENQTQKENKTRFSILVAFRNEEENLNTLLNSIKELSYPTHLFELILVNDGSTDRSEQIIHSALADSNIQFFIFNNERCSASPKKDAITKAVKNAKYEWILTTDADCILNSDLLNCYDQYIQNNEPYMIVGPVGIEKGKGMNYYFQQYEHLALQTFTAGGFGMNAPFLCNGANLVYLKELFTEVEGYVGNDHISSGDDIFLFEKFREKFPKNIHFIRSEKAIVLTASLSSWSALIEQRVRWASKISSQNNPISKIMGLCIFITNLWLILGLIYCMFAPDQIVHFLIFLFYKLLVDLIVVSGSALFFSVRINMVAFTINSLLYPYVSVWVAIRGLLGSYHWKDRQYSKPLM